jgi:transmembrane 9 superfamily member 2/4
MTVVTIMTMTTMQRLLFKLVLLYSAVPGVKASLFSVEYGSPKSYQKNEIIPLKVYPMTSVHTLIDSSEDNLPFCHPPARPGTSMMAQMMPYEVDTLLEVRCQKLCQVMPSTVEANNLSFHIKTGYHHNWKLDGLPAANMVTRGDIVKTHYGGGFPVGFGGAGDSDTYIFNHVKLVVSYNYRARSDSFRIVGFNVEPISIKHRYAGGYEWDGLSLMDVNKSLETCPTPVTAADFDHFVNFENVDAPQIVKAGEMILFTYDVTWFKSEVEWSHRWDVYLTEDDFVPGQVHIYSIVNSVLVAIVLSSVVSCILVRNLKRDVAASRGRSEDDDECRGWKALGGDVFRPPQTLPNLFCAMVGTGAQLALTAVLVLLLAMVNLVSPAKPGSLGHAIWIIYIFLGSPIAGYVSGHLHRSLGGQDLHVCASLTALLFPGITLAYFLATSFTRSGTNLTWILVLFWGTCSCLVSFALIKWVYSKLHQDQGKAYGFPTMTARVNRNIPPPTCLGCRELLFCICTGVSPYCASMKLPWVTVLLVGLISFAAVYVELFFIMIGLFMYQYYWSFGYFLVVYILLIVTCTQVTILIVYHRLNNENHLWWWPSFFGGGSIGFYIFGYSLLWVPSLELLSSSIVSYFLYFGTMFMISLGAFLLCGSMGTLASLCFVCKLFSTVRPREEGDYVELMNIADDMDEVVEEREDAGNVTGLEDHAMGTP